MLPPSWRTLGGDLFLLSSCNSCFSLSVFSPHGASTEKQRGKIRGSICHHNAELPFTWLLYMGRNLRPDSPSDPFSSSLPHHFKLSLVAARLFRDDCLEIQSCIFLVLCADRKQENHTWTSCKAENTVNPLSHQEMNNQMFHNTHSKPRLRKTLLLTALRWTPGFWINSVLLMHSEQSWA